MTTSIKTCFKCETSKPLTEFYKHAMMADGHLNKCKACAKADARSHRSENIDRIREQDRKRGGLPHRIAARESYAQSEGGKMAVARAKAKWTATNPTKRKANNIVNSNITFGTIQKPEACECCGVSGKRLEGHHADYSKPLELDWLCSKCHRQWHKENGEGLNAG